MSRLSIVYSGRELQFTTTGCRCPEIVLLNGEDLTPYRAASKQILGVLGRFGVVEKYSPNSDVCIPVKSFNGSFVASS